MPLVEGGPGQADPEREPADSRRGEATAARERAVPERGEDRVLGEVRPLAHESVDGGEVAGRCPGQEPVEQGQEELARVRRAAGVGRQKHDDTHPEHRGEPVGGTHRLLSYRA